MTRERIARAAIRAYPGELRAKREDELISTLLDAADAAPTMFQAELMSVIIGGLTARARSAVSQPVSRLATDSLRWGAVIAVVSGMLTTVAEYAHWGNGLGLATLTSWQEFLAPLLLLALFVAGRDRGAGVIGLSWCVTTLIRSPQLSVSDWLSLLVLPILGFGLMTLTPRRPREPMLGLVAIPLIAWMLFRWTELGQISGAGYLLPVIAAAPLVAIKPAVTIGTALAWSLLAASFLTIPVTHYTVLSIAMLSGMPVTVGLLVLARRILRAR